MGAETEIMKLREKLAAEAANSKQKEVEIDSLKKHIAELINDKKQVRWFLFSCCLSCIICP